MLLSPSQCSQDKHCGTEAEHREGTIPDQVKASSLMEIWGQGGVEGEPKQQDHLWRLGEVAADAKC